MKSEKLAKRKVLIADDDEACRAMLALLLDLEGWEVKTAQNGTETLEKVHKEQPNLLILDHRIPELTGAEVYQHIQAREIKIAVVLVSAYGNIHQLASSLGISYFVSKPYNIPEFLETIESAYQNFLRQSTLN
jgi:two-component system response regulator (stage 0 sporulation protein F)